jgi:hypothetical protein
MALNGKKVHRHVPFARVKQPVHGVQLPVRYRGRRKSLTMRPFMQDSSVRDNPKTFYYIEDIRIIKHFPGAEIKKNSMGMNIWWRFT